MMPPIGLRSWQQHEQRGLPVHAFVLRVTLAEDAAAPEEVESLTYSLRNELLTLDLDSVDLPRADDTPPGAKAAEVAVVGTLVLTLSSANVLSSVVGVIRGWLIRSAGRSVRLEIDGDILEAKGVNAAEQSRLVDEWVTRHSING